MKEEIMKPYIGAIVLYNLKNRKPVPAVVFEIDTNDPYIVRVVVLADIYQGLNTAYILNSELEGWSWPKTNIEESSLAEYKKPEEYLEKLQEPFDFSIALKLAKQGKKVKRKDWNDADCFDFKFSLDHNISLSIGLVAAEDWILVKE